MNKLHDLIDSVVFSFEGPEYSHLIRPLTHQALEKLKNYAT